VPLAESVYLKLKNRILEGIYLPGFHLVETDLTEEFHVSRVTIREALMRLASDGLAVSTPNRGVMVRKLTQQDLLDLYIIREYLEGLSARLLTEQPDPNILQALKENLQEGELLVSQQLHVEYRKNNNAFHRIIGHSSNNQYLVKSLDQLYTQLISLQFPGSFNQNIELSHMQHILIYKAICTGAADAAEEAMRNHIRHAKQLLSKHP
jgi:DNA-binding GntR family transcriptional regulator